MRIMMGISSVSNDVLIAVWVIKKGPLNEFNQYDYAIISTWVRYPVIVVARDPERFRTVHMKNVLQFLEDNSKFQ